MACSELQSTATPEVFASRRAALAAKLDRPLLVCAGRGRPRQIATNPNPFRPGSHYIYFGGPAIEGAALLIEPGSDGHKGTTLLRDPQGYEDAVWLGDVPGDDMLAAFAGIDESQIAPTAKLSGLCQNRDAEFVAPPCMPTQEWARSTKLVPANEATMLAIIDLRLTKDDHELAAMRRAASITAKAFDRTIRMAAPGVRESDLAGAFHSVLMAEQGRPSFSPIITVNGQVLHLEGYPNRLDSGRLLLVDGGAEEPGGYACDVTRTFPVSGKFSDIQQQLYEIVLRAERTSIAACQPGRRYRDVHDLSAKVICEGLVDVGLMRGNPEELLERRAHTLFFPHGVGHLLGLDAHDLEDFGDLGGYPAGRSRREGFGDKYLRLDRDLEPGMVVTVEPGIYLVPAIWQQESLHRPFADAVDYSAIRALLEGNFGGIRIEDDVCVCATGEPEIMTADIPSDVEALEAIIGRS